MKIAIVNTLFFPNENYQLIDDYFITSEVFFESAKKYFLVDHDVEYLLITNTKKKIKKKYIKTIVVDHRPSEYHHILLMKVLAIKYIKEKYDYIFVSDSDQIFVNHVVDSDLLDVDYNLTQHFMRLKYKDALPTMTKFVNVKHDDETPWVMGNFYGGRYENIMEMCEMTQKNHDELYGRYIMNEFGFYSKYPDELFISKYAYETNVNYKFLSSEPTFDENTKAFLSDFSLNENDYLNKKKVKLLHNTKKDINFLKKIRNKI